MAKECLDCLDVRSILEISARPGMPDKVGGVLPFDNPGFAEKSRDHLLRLADPRGFTAV